MRPPICAVCHERLQGNEGGLVSFAMRPSDTAWQKRMEASAAKGHPPWKEWFCAKHITAARALDALPRDEAMNGLRGA